jgi:hypothetical protein
VTRGGLRLAVVLLFIAAPLHARADEATGGETTVIQDASGRIVVVPAKSAASAPKRVVPVKLPPSAARQPLPKYEPHEPPAARDGANGCSDHDALVELWLAARKRVIAAQQELEVAESIPLSGMGGYRAARIAGAERALEKAETRESEIDTQARSSGVPPSCFDDSGLDASDD